ncbi:MAG: YdcF family protein [Smithella sp.]
MDDFYTICKGLTDPVFIIFILLIVALIFCFIGRRKNSNILILVLGLAVLFLYGASISPVANYLAYSLEKDYFRAPAIKKPLDIIVVLGGGAHDIHALDRTYASETSVARLLHGVEVFNKYGAKYFICAGKGSAKMSEAEVMAQMALALGVPKEKIRIDAKSNNTWEHVVELNKIFTNNDIYIGIVTSGYHMKRSEREFKKYFKNVMPLPASYLYSSATEKNVLKYIPQTTVLNATATSLRERISSIWYEIKGI